MTSISPTLLALGILALLEPAAAQDPASQAQEEAAHPGGHGGSADEGHASGIHHRHHAGLFVGGSVEGSERGFTIGGDYELRLHRLIGVGAVGEWVGGDLKEVVFAFPVLAHPFGGLRLGAGPGFVRKIGDHGDSQHGVTRVTPSAGSSENKTKPILRLTALYDIFFKSFSVTPSASIDFLDRDEVLVFGVTFGFGF